VNLPAQLFSADWLWLCNLVFAVLLYRGLRSAPWREVVANGLRTNALVGLMLGAFVFWQLNAGIRPGFNFHLNGATLFVLMFGWQVALACVSLIMLSTWLYADMALVTLGINGLLMVVIPVMFSEWVLRFSRRRLPKNLFLFVLWNGFGCAALAMLMTVAAATVLLLALSPYNWQQIQHHYLVAAPIIMLTEAFTTGAMITAFTVFQPEAVMNFSDEEYLAGK